MSFPTGNSGAHTHWLCKNARGQLFDSFCDKVNTMSEMNCAKCLMYREIGTVALNSDLEEIGELTAKPEGADGELWTFPSTKATPLSPKGSAK
ncbi:hypothetical protein ACHAPU_006411 [Fusarium lateritium]